MSEENTPLQSYLRAMPKVELHVHLEGAIQPETLLTLARRNKVELPAGDIEGLRRWYAFRDFGHFIEIYKTIGRCLRTAEDIELITREFLAGQAAQNIRHTEATYTAYSQYTANRIPFEDQLEAIHRARAWAEETHGVTLTLTLDISREIAPEEGMVTAEWAVSGMGRGVTALGLGGPEAGNPPEKFLDAFALARQAGLASVPHAGEVAGPESIRDALELLDAVRIGHGVRCLEDPEVVAILRERQIPLEVCPTSNIRLKVFPSLPEHPLPRLLEEGLYVTVNSDDPPMFNTTLTDEYLLLDAVFGFGLEQIEDLALNAVRACLLPESRRMEMTEEFTADFNRLRREHHLPGRDRSTDPG
jgi:adenosine deaminase